MSKERWILHADMDAFYASVEQRDDPSLQGKPVIVGGSGARGVVSAASYEARTFGVRSAMPGYKARELCPQGVFLRGDMKKYAAASQSIHAIFEDFTDQIEPLALDEAFLDITGSLNLFGSPQEIGKKIKARVKHELDLVISIGIGPNKLLAKVACTQGKPDGLLLVTQEEARDLLNPLPVRALWGVGPKAEARLKLMHIHTIRQLVSAPDDYLKKAFGDRFEAMRKRAQGIDDRPVEFERIAKSIGEESTFTDNVTAVARISAAITAHAEKVASRARRAQMRGLTVTLKVKLSRRKNWGTKIVSNQELFPILNRQQRLKSATADASEIREVALALWTKLGVKEPVRLLGVTLSDLQPDHDPRQMNLFDVAPMPTSHSRLGKKDEESKWKTKEARKIAQNSLTRSEALGKTMDAISDKFGEGAIGRAVEGLEKATHAGRVKLGEKK